MDPCDPQASRSDSPLATALFLLALFLWTSTLFAIPGRPGLASFLYLGITSGMARRLHRNRSGKLAWAGLAIPFLLVAAGWNEGVSAYRQGSAYYQKVSYGMPVGFERLDDDPTTRIRTRSVSGGCIAGSFEDRSSPQPTPYWDVVHFLCAVAGPMPGHYRGPYPDKSTWCRLLAEKGSGVLGRDLEAGQGPPGARQLGANLHRIEGLPLALGPSQEARYRLLPLGDSGLLVRILSREGTRPRAGSLFLVDLENLRVVATDSSGNCDLPAGSMPDLAQGWMLPTEEGS